MSINVLEFAVYVPYACATLVPNPASSSGVPDVLFILKSPPSLCVILIAPLNSPELTTSAVKFVKFASENAVTKSSASPNVEPSPDTIVTVFAESNASWFLIDSLTVNVSFAVKLGEVVLDCITVVPPSYLKSWKSPTFGVVSCWPASIDCSVILNCVYNVPAAIDVPPFVGSKLKIA